MRIVFFSNFVVPHQTPLANELVSLLGAENYAYVYYRHLSKERIQLGYPAFFDAVWIKKYPEDIDSKEFFMEKCTLLISGARLPDLFEERTGKSLLTFYSSERWFKPLTVSFCGITFGNMPGIIRLLYPPYLKMAIRIARLMRSRFFYYLPYGIHAARDMARLCGIVNGDIRCLFRAPRLDFDGKPGGRIWLRPGCHGDSHCLAKMRMWGYFVSPSVSPVPLVCEETSQKQTLRVLWVGRFLRLKHVDTIIRAVGECAKHMRTQQLKVDITLDVYGTGPAESSLKALAARYGDVIRFYSQVPIEVVRTLMRQHDVYVLASDANEGWGAVVNEALEEGMKVLGTYEAGASATILPPENLFHAGDVDGLMRLLQHTIAPANIGPWTAKNAARVLLEMAEECCAK